MSFANCCIFFGFRVALLIKTSLTIAELECWILKVTLNCLSFHTAGVQPFCCRSTVSIPIRPRFTCALRSGCPPSCGRPERSGHDEAVRPLRFVRGRGPVQRSRIRIVGRLLRERTTGDARSWTQRKSQWWVLRRMPCHAICRLLMWIFGLLGKLRSVMD